MRYVTTLFAFAVAIAAGTFFLPTETALLAFSERALAASQAAAPADPAATPSNGKPAVTSEVTPPDRAAPVFPSRRFSVAPTTTPFGAPGNSPSPSPASSGWGYGPYLWYWENNSYQNNSKSVCAVNSEANLRFYVQYSLCNYKCLGGWGANPYRWNITIYRDGVSVWSQNDIVRTSAVWINWSVVLATPVLPGLYHAKLKLEKRTFISSWQTVFDQNTQDIVISNPTQPIAQAPVPQIRLEVVANSSSDSTYRLRGWQTNANAALIGQWNIFDSDANWYKPSQPRGNTKFTGWAAPGTVYTMNSNLDFGKYYLLEYGNYSDAKWNCYSWNATSRLIYIEKR